MYDIPPDHVLCPLYDPTIIPGAPFAPQTTICGLGSRQGPAARHQQQAMAPIWLGWRPNARLKRRQAQRVSRKQGQGRCLAHLSPGLLPLVSFQSLARARAISCLKGRVIVRHTNDLMPLLNTSLKCQEPHWPAFSTTPAANTNSIVAVQLTRRPSQVHSKHLPLHPPRHQAPSPPPRTWQTRPPTAPTSRCCWALTLRGSCCRCPQRPTGRC